MDKQEIVLEVKASEPISWLEEFAEQLDFEIRDNRVDLPSWFGEGYIQFIQLSEGLYVNIKDVILKKPLLINKRIVDDQGFYPIIFQYSDAKIRQETNGEQIEIGKNTPNGIIIPSHQIPTRIYFPSGVKILTLAIILSQDWINKNLKEGSEAETAEKISFLKQLFISQRPYFIYESVVPKIAEVLEAILFERQPSTLLPVFFHGKILELLALLFEQLIQREFEGAYENLNALDVEAVFQTQKIIQDSYDNPPTIQNLAREIGMSESKLKKIFKQVFGHSIYQYILHNRMNKARHLLDTRRYNVSEVGSLLGYSNLAHFAKAFKKQFNVSPSTYLSSLR